MENTRMRKSNDAITDFCHSNWHFSRIMRDIFNKVTGLDIIEDKNGIENINDFNSQISGIVLLNGERNVIISVSMSYQASTALVAYMSNLSNAEIKLQEQSDGVAELVNMIAGQTKAKLASMGQRFTYIQPFVVVGDNHHILQKKNVSSLKIKFHSGVIDIFLTVSLL